MTRCSQRRRTAFAKSPSPYPLPEYREREAAAHVRLPGGDMLAVLAKLTRTCTLRTSSATLRPALTRASGCSSADRRTFPLQSRHLTLPEGALRHLLGRPE